MRLFSLIVLLLLTVISSGCLPVQHENQQVSAEKSASEKELINDLLATWNITYDLTYLEQAVRHELKRWEKPQNAIPFVITDLLQSEIEHIGLFSSPNEWELKGKHSAGSSFVLKNDEGSIILSHGSHQQSFGQDNFKFLLPVEHLVILQEILQAKNYEYLSWNRVDNGWSVEIRTSIQPLEQVFVDYLQEHFFEKKTELEYQFHGFSIWYTLQLREVEDYLVLKGINFSLIRHEQHLDTLQFLL